MPLVKNSRYTNKDYCISFGKADVVEVALTLDIRLIPSPSDGIHDRYEIAGLTIKPFAEQEFVTFLLDKLPTETRLEVYATLLDLATKELTPELFSLFYCGELLPDSFVHEEMPPAPPTPKPETPDTFLSV